MIMAIRVVKLPPVLSQTLLISTILRVVLEILVLSSLYYKTGTIRCLGLHFSDRMVRLIEIFEKKSNQVA